MEFSRQIVKMIEARRRDLNLTGAEVASYVGVSPSQYSNIVSGRSKLSLDQLEGALRGLGLELMVLRVNSSIEVADGMVITRDEGFPVNVSRSWRER